MANRPDQGLFGIKLILPAHLQHAFFTDDFDGRDGKRTLMNFADSGNGPAIAANIPIGHRSLVYCTKPIGGFLWAIEYTGSLADGRSAAKSHGLKGNEYGTWNVMRPIRIIARIHDPARAVTPAVLFERSGGQGKGIVFKPNSFTHAYITQEQYKRMFAVIGWDWSADREKL